MNTKTGLHPRNKHKSLYNFNELINCHPLLSAFVKKNAYNNDSVDFSNPQAVIALNTALLKYYYAIDNWILPKDYLCPPIPGRADYIHYVADLLGIASGTSAAGIQIKMLDIGVGANCIYPLIAHREYGWKIVGSEIDPKAISNARQIISSNQLESQIEIRAQNDSKNIFKNIIHPEDYFHITVCNPPFHSSAHEAKMVAEKKNRNLKIKSKKLNFQGVSNELWCVGGEERFLVDMIHESILFKNQSLWFSSLVSKSTTLPILYAELKKANALNIRTIDMSQGQKKTRIIAWSFNPQKY